VTEINLSDILFQGETHKPFLLSPPQARVDGAFLLLHGFPGTPAEMRPLGEQLAETGWLAYGPLLPGFGAEIGKLGDTGSRDWLRAARQAGMTLRRRKRPLILCGYSLGGAIALNVAAAVRPDALILLAPFWRSQQWWIHVTSALKHIWPEFAPLARADFQDPQLRQFLAEMMPSVDLTDPVVLRALRSQLTIRTSIVEDLLRVGREAFAWAGQLKIPTLILQGAQDEVVTPDATRTLVGQFGGPVAYYELPGGHAFLKEMSDNGSFDLQRLILPFIERNLH
jgi:carboxylesterase